MPLQVAAPVWQRHSPSPLAGTPPTNRRHPHVVAISRHGASLRLKSTQATSAAVQLHRPSHWKDVGISRTKTAPGISALAAPIQADQAPPQHIMASTNANPSPVAWRASVPAHPPALPPPSIRWHQYPHGRSKYSAQRNNGKPPWHFKKNTPAHGLKRNIQRAISALHASSTRIHAHSPMDTIRPSR